jgi:hypothetical protein
VEEIDIKRIFTPNLPGRVVQKRILTENLQSSFQNPECFSLLPSIANNAIKA